LHYFIEFDRIAGHYVTVVEDRPIMFAKYSLPVVFGQTDPRSSRTVSLRQLSFLLYYAKLVSNWSI